MRNLVMMALALALAAVAHQLAAAEPCAADNRVRVAANDECLVIRAYGESAERTSLIIFIHGDGYRGGHPTICIGMLEDLGRRVLSLSA